VDIAYERLLADLKEYGDKKKAEEACKTYAEEKKKQRRKAGTDQSASSWIKSSSTIESRPERT